MAMTSLVRLMLKRGLVTDLARLPHSLDLSSPSMVSTINKALKPLETLSRIVNQPQTVVSKAPGKKSGGDTCVVVEPTSGSSNNTTQANVTEGQDDPPPGPDGMVTIEDVTDDAEGHNDLEETSELHAEEPDDTVMGSGATPAEAALAAVEVGLEQVLDTLLGRDEEGSAQDNILGEIIMGTDGRSRGGRQAGDSQDVLIDVEVQDEDDSQMVSQMSDDEGHDEMPPTQGNIQGHKEFIALLGAY